jgi:Tfp pilus assembly protein PilO
VKALSLRQQGAAVAGGVIVIAVVAYFGLVAPKLREINVLNGQVRQQKARTTQRPPAPPVAISDAERKLWATLEQRLRERYPSESELPKALASVAQLARGAGMTPLSLEVVAPPARAGTPPAAAPPAPSAPVFQLPPELAVNGPTIRLVAGSHRYRDLVRFVDGLGTAPVAVAVRALDVKRTDDQLTTEIMLTSFRWAR